MNELTTEVNVKNEVAVSEKSMSERFMMKVINEFGSSVGEVALTKFQKRLAQNYFIAIDECLKKTEQKRLAKSGDYQDPTPCTWANVNMESLARSIVSAARVGLDPNEKNHISPTPYKNKNTQKYDIGFIIGYRGLQLKAFKYGLDIPDSVICELVYSTDRFKSHKRDFKNKVESFEFEILNDFDRGEIIGGFYYHEFAAPEKNKLVVFSKKDLEKRKPKYASAEFWGGEKDVWQNGKKTGKEVTDGWYEAMMLKTIIRAAYGAITIDSQKIDDDYMVLSDAERLMGFGDAEENLHVAHDTEANRVLIDIVDNYPQEEGEIDTDTGEVLTPPVTERQSAGPSF